MNPFECIFVNNYQGLVTYLENGNVNVTDDRGKTLLDYAIQFHNNDIFELLIKSYINVNIKDNLGNTAIHYAVINNKLGYLKTLLQIPNVDPKVVNNTGHSPLYLACLYGREQMVLLFLETMELDLSYEDNNGETVFMALVRSRNLDLIKRLGGYQDLLEKKNVFGQTPLAVAVKQNSTKMVEFLLENNVFVNTKDNFNETPLFSSYINENKEITSLLLQKGAIFNMKDKLSETIFNKPVEDEFLDYVLEKIDVLKLKDYEKIFPLHYNLYLNDENKIKNFLTIEHVNRKDIYGYTPLDIAKYYQNVKLIRQIEDKIREINKNIRLKSL